MADGVTERLGQLEGAVRRAGEALARLRDENARLTRELAQAADERKQTLAQIDSILKDVAKLDLE
jgi:ABC-type transporter Mla subunit MlaD